MGYSRRMRKVLLCTLVFIASMLPAQEGVWELSFGPRIIGATLDTRYVTTTPTVNDVETSVTGRLSSAYEAVGFHSRADGSLLFID